MKLFICGFMGAGKTHALRSLKLSAAGTNFDLVDLDEYIARKLEIQDVSEVINDKGLDYFRVIERQAIEELGRKQDIVLSLGGGSLNEATIELFDEWKGLWLKTDFALCIERIKGTTRPLATKSVSELKDLYEQRLEWYSRYPEVNNVQQIKEIILKN